MALVRREKQTGPYLLQVDKEVRPTIPGNQSLCMWLQGWQKKEGLTASGDFSECIYEAG